MMDDIAQQLAQRVSEKLPEIIQQLLREGHDPTECWESLQLECRLVSTSSTSVSNGNAAGSLLSEGRTLPVAKASFRLDDQRLRRSPGSRRSTTGPVVTEGSSDGMSAAVPAPAPPPLEVALADSTATPATTAPFLPSITELEDPRVAAAAAAAAASSSSSSADWNFRPRPLLRRSLPGTTPPGENAGNDDNNNEAANPNKRRRRDVGSLRIVSTTNGNGNNGSHPTTPNPSSADAEAASSSIRRLGSEGRVFPQRRKRVPENPALQPSTLEKFIAGIWESLYSGVRLDPAGLLLDFEGSGVGSHVGNERLLEEGAAAGGGVPALITDTDTELATRADSGAFTRMNVLTRRISQTSRTCRSLEVIVQAHWIQCFDDRVSELRSRPTTPGEKAKKTALAEACLDFHWTEKELRNKMAIWRGYHEIQVAGGWAALVFAGMGLYRFCKYRVAFTDEAFNALRALRHRFEVAADTLHPRWRALLAIVGESVERVYPGHPHDWVVCASAPASSGGHLQNQQQHQQCALPLPQTYVQWDPHFSYTHLDSSELDADAWGDYDPRTVFSPSDPRASQCQSCGESQSDDPRVNTCQCFPNLYGGAGGSGAAARAVGSAVPVQVFRTSNGKNNGLLACCGFERGAAVGEFVGEITSGIDGLDVMVGQTERASYQIWQGKAGNHTRFVNHSCQPNSQFERFVWRGTQRIVLVSKGIEAGEEITVDYSDTYWRNLDKKCLCERANCRYRHRAVQAASTTAPDAVVEPRSLLPSPPEEVDADGNEPVWSR